MLFGALIVISIQFCFLFRYVVNENARVDRANEKKEISEADGLVTIK